MSKDKRVDSGLSGRERSLKNLEKRKPFTSETAAKAAPKAAKAKSENCKYRKAVEASLNNLLKKGALNYVTDIQRFAMLRPTDQLAILQHLADYSGQKPKDTPEAIVMPVINIKGL